MKSTVGALAIVVGCVMIIGGASTMFATPASLLPLVLGLGLVTCGGLLIAEALDERTRRASRNLETQSASRKRIIDWRSRGWF